MANCLFNVAKHGIRHEPQIPTSNEGSDSIGFPLNYTMFGTLAIKTYICKSKINFVKKVTPLRIEPDNSCDAL